jgi:hypothetical protein
MRSTTCGRRADLEVPGVGLQRLSGLLEAREVGGNRGEQPLHLVAREIPAHAQDLVAPGIGHECGGHAHRLIADMESAIAAFQHHGHETSGRLHDVAVLPHVMVHEVTVGEAFLMDDRPGRNRVLRLVPPAAIAAEEKEQGPALLLGGGEGGGEISGPGEPTAWGRVGGGQGKHDGNRGDHECLQRVDAARG